MIKNLAVLTTIIVASSLAISTGAFAACTPSDTAGPQSLVDDNSYSATNGLGIWSDLTCGVKSKLDTTAFVQAKTAAPRAPAVSNTAVPTSLFD